MRPAWKISPQAWFVAFLFLLWACASGCAPALVEPAGSSSALVIGRVVVHYERKSLSGEIAQITVKDSLVVEFVNRERRGVVSVATDEEGYFFLPNIRAGAYELSRVRIEKIVAALGGSATKTTYEFKLPPGRLAFSPVQGKVAYAGGVVLYVNDRGFSSGREEADAEGAKNHFFRKWAASPWAAREMIPLRSKPASEAF
jgi:hypothetical protein